MKKNNLVKTSLLVVFALALVVTFFYANAQLIATVDAATVSLGSETTVTSPYYRGYAIQHNLHCPTGQIVTGVQYTGSTSGDSDATNNIEIQCSTLNSDGTLTLAPAWIVVPNAGDQAFGGQLCPAGYVYAGLYQKNNAGNWTSNPSANPDNLDGIAAHCIQISSNGLGSALAYMGNRDIDAPGSTCADQGGSLCNRSALRNVQCPSNTVLVGLDFDMKGSAYAANPTAVDSTAKLYCANVLVSALSAPTCSSNSDCGTNSFTGGNFCQGNGAYRNFTTYTCNNPGTANSFCSNSTAAQLQQTCSANQTCSAGSCVNLNIACNTNSDCGANGLTGGPFCQGNGVYQNFRTFTCNNPGTANSFCSNSTAAQLQQTCSGSQTCSGGSCVNLNIACNTSADCGTNSFTGGNFCQSNGVYRNFTTYTCNNPGTANSFCSNSTAAQLQQICTSNQTCSAGSCTTTATTCTPFASQRCSGNAVYWYDSCGNQGSLSQFCGSNQVCSNNACVNITSACTSHASFRCSGNGVYWFDSCGNKQDLYQACTSNQICPVSATACVNQAINTTLLVTKTSRNLSSGNLTWSASTAAGPSDVIQFNIAIQNTGSQAVNNVTVRDVFPTNLTYYNSLTLDGVANSGSIVSGLNIGAVLAGQTRNITYQAQVAPSTSFSFGTTTLTNSASITSTDTGFIPATGSASIVVTRTSVQGATTVSTGLTNNFWIDSFFLPLLIALAGIWLFKSGFIGVPAWVTDKKDKRASMIAQKQLDQKIMQIKNREGLIS